MTPGGAGKDGVLAKESEILCTACACDSPKYHVLSYKVDMISNWTRVGAGVASLATWAAM